MIKAIFSCDIVDEDGEVIEEDFDFDEGLFENDNALEEYIQNSNYEIGEPCGYWGNDVGILKEIVRDDDE